MRASLHWCDGSAPIKSEEAGSSEYSSPDPEHLTVDDGSDPIKTTALTLPSGIRLRRQNV